MCARYRFSCYWIKLVQCSFLHLKRVFKSEFEPRKSISPSLASHLRPILPASFKIRHIIWTCGIQLFIFSTKFNLKFFFKFMSINVTRLAKTGSRCWALYVSGQEYLTSHLNRMDNCFNFFLSSRESNYKNEFWTYVSSNNIPTRHLEAKLKGKVSCLPIFYYSFYQIKNNAMVGYVLWMG